MSSRKWICWLQGSLLALLQRPHRLQRSASLLLLRPMRQARLVRECGAAPPPSGSSEGLILAGQLIALAIAIPAAILLVAVLPV
jgi:hypothetical protein